MRIANCKKVKFWLLSCLVFLTAALCTVFGVKVFNPVSTRAEEVTTNRTLLSGEYQTNGASMRIFRATSSGDLETISETEQGIRFHVEMGSGYKYGTTTLFDEINKNERGSWTIAEGFTTYTLILPKRLMGGATELTPTTDKVMKLDTTDYWFTDDNGNIESIAYIYKIPAAFRTDTFVFKGIICDENGNVIAETETSERCLAFIAKMSYKDTINPDTIMWGTQEKPLDDVAAPLLKAFVPTYTINYGDETTEEVLWGDKPANIPSFETPEGGHIEYTQAWFDKDNNVEFDLEASMNWTEDKTFNLVHASAAEFNLTGVADYNNFVVDSIGYSGVKLYATLEPSQFFTADEIANGTDKMVKVATNAENFTYEGNGSFNGVNGVWALLEGKGNSAQMRLVVAFDSSSMVSGDKIIVKEGSAFYANNVMYVLSQEYTIDYDEVNDIEDYGVFLGYLYNSDIKSVKNWIEPTDATRKRIRVEFRKDTFINSDFKIVYDGELPSGYEYPLYVHCEQGGGITPITKGFYYWNNGEHTILELEGFGHHGDEMLYGAPGLKIVQNGGYFIYKDAIKWENDGNGHWVEGTEKGTFGANSFEIIGKHASDTTEVRFTTNGNTTLTAGGTTDRWFNGTPTLNVENMSESEPYAVFATKPDGTVMPLESFKYHGQDIASGYHHIFAFADYEGTVAGETITILGGSRFWFESEYYTASETIVFYFNGMNWIVNTDGTANKTITMDNFIGNNYNFLEGGVNKLRMHLVEDASLFNGGNGVLTLESGSVKVNGRAYTQFRYHGQYVDSKDGLTKYHMIFEIIGDELAPIGQTAFGDTLVIEAGTRLWIGIDEAASAQPYCIEFSETLEWRYVGEGMKDGSGNPFKYEWIRTDRNTNLDHTSILSMYDATDAGGEVRLNLKAGTLTDNFYGFMAMDTSKGVPIVNGIEMPNEAFAYGAGNQLFAVRGGEYGNALENYIIIPEGSVWWTTQGSFTFVETIYGVVRSLKDNGTGNWTSGFNTLTSLGDISATDFMGAENYTEILQDTELYKEIRVRISREYSNTYYGTTAIIGEAVVEKANGTQAKALFGQWYSGTAYEADHSIVSFRGDAMIDVTDGDVFTIKAGTKLVLGGLGYHTLLEDVSYTYLNGLWQNGNLHATVTYNGTDATVSGTTEALQGGTCTFTAKPNSGYVITEVIVNGNSLAITENNEYSFTAISGENQVVVTAKKLYAVTWSNPTGATISVSANGSAVANGATVVEGTVLTVNATAAVSHNVTGITANGAAVTNGGTYTVTGATTIAATTAIKTYTVTANCSGGVSVDATSKTVQHSNNVTFTLNVPANATIKANGTVINGNSYTVNNVTANTTVTFTTWYNVTINAGNSTVSGDAAGLYESGTELSISAVGKTGYNVTNITANDTSIGTTSGTYTVTGATTIAVVTELKTYTVTANCSGGVSVDATSKTVQHGNNVTFTLNVPANATIKANGTVINGNSYTVNNVTANTTVTFTTWYNVTINAGNSTVSGDAAGLYESGDTFDFTVADTVSHNVTGVTANGDSIGTAASSYSVKVNGATTIAVATAEKTKYKVSWTNPTGATITVSANETGAVSNGGQVYVGQTLTVTVAANNDYRLNTVTIGGTVQNGVSTARNGSFTGNYQVSGNTTIAVTTVKMYAVSWTATNATISVTANGASITSGTYVDDKATLSITVSAAQYYAITGVNVNGGSIGTEAASYEYTVSATTTISNTAEKTHYSLTFKLTSIDSVSNVKDSAGATYTASNNATIWVPVGRTVTFTVKVSNSEMDSATADKGTLTQTSYDNDKTYTYSYKPTAANDYATITLKGNCIVEGTLITLADGTQKPVEDLTGNELLLVWNLETGRYDAAPIIFVDSDERMEYTVVTLYFSNGAEVGVVSEHGFFDVELGQYVYLNELNAVDYIGREFVTQGSIEDNTWDSAILINAVVEQKVVKVYSPVTFSHLCYYVDGVLSMPGGIDGLFNIFDVDTTTMSYDAEKMAKDIETYGLFTYEDFENIIPEEVYEAFNGAWLKVAMGKDLIDWETIERYATRYLPLM